MNRWVAWLGSIGFQARLAGAWATPEQLAKAGSLRGTILPDGTVHQ